MTHISEGFVILLLAKLLAYAFGIAWCAGLLWIVATAEDRR